MRRGLLFLNNRYHDPVLGAFISVDPLVTTTGKAYMYAGGNPVTYSDPTGLCSYFSGDTDQWTCEFYNPPNDPEDVLGRTTTVSGQGGYTSDCRTSDGEGCNSPAPPPQRRPPEMRPISDAPRLWNEVITGFDDGAPGGGLGVCGEASGTASNGVVGATGGVANCAFFDTEGAATLSSVGAGPSLGTPGVAGSAGVVISNADAEGLAEWGICGNAGGGAGAGGAGALCGSIAYVDGDWAYTGAWTFYAGLSLTTPSAGVSYTYTYTWVDRHWRWPW